MTLGPKLLCTKIMKTPAFDPADFKAIRVLYAEGKFPPGMKLRYIVEQCAAKKGRLKCIKVGKEWRTREVDIRAWLYDKMDSDFRKITS